LPQYITSQTTEERNFVAYARQLVRSAKNHPSSVGYCEFSGIFRWWGEFCSFKTGIPGGLGNKWGT